MKRLEGKMVGRCYRGVAAGANLDGLDFIILALNRKSLRTVWKRIGIGALKSEKLKRAAVITETML